MLTKNGDFVRCEDGISLHSKIVDLTYDAFPADEKEKKAEPSPKPEAKKGHDEKDHKESETKEDYSGPKDSQSEPEKKLV